MGYGKVLTLGIISIVAGAFAGPIFLAFGILCTLIGVIAMAYGNRKKKRLQQHTQVTSTPTTTPAAVTTSLEPTLPKGMTLKHKGAV